MIDFKIAKRHNLELKNIIDNYGNMENIIGLSLLVIFLLYGIS